MSPRDINRLLAPLARRIRLIVSRAVVTVVYDGLKMQGLQLTLLAGETADQVERFQEYGFTSVPKAGAEAIAAAIGGARGHLVAIAVDDRRYRMQDMQPGEVALYTDEGDYIKLSRGRIIQVVAGAEVDVTAPTIKFTASNSMTFDTPQAHFTGAVAPDGDMVAEGTSGHTHTHPDPQGGSTGAPN